MSAANMSQGRASSRAAQASNDPPARRIRRQQPQKTVEDFWDAFITKFPGKVHTILPRNAYASSKAAREPKGTVHGRGALKSYEEARAECELAVRQVAKECRRVNMRYRDPHFDVDLDLKMGYRRCLDCISGHDPDDSPRPRAVKRVPEIFRKPQFYIDGARSADVRQGKTGDCYFLAAVGALGNKEGLIDRCCVDKDELVGVYGFVFFRDGEWIHTVIDDKLYLSIPDYDESRGEKDNWAEIMNRNDAEMEYKEAFQTGSRALYFAQCNDENETWLPLLEKAYAKAHGDYYSIIGGFTGEAIEDLTGGVTTELFATDILDKDRFWDEELRHVGKQFLFGCATGRFDDWQGGDDQPWRQGIVSAHAYTILRAATYKGERLLLVRNPWGQAEWSGRWSDGSEQWTPESMQELAHRFGDDGMFWISYEDLLRKYQYFDRTRLFDESWTIAQQWTSVDVRWTADYNETKFTLTLTEATPVVLVLSQLDDRYWCGLEGQYTFNLHFRVDKHGEDGYVVRSHGNYWMSRSVSTEVDLEAGTYSIFIKVKADRDLSAPRVEDVVRRNCKTNQEKLMQVGLAYDLAHAKGMVHDTEEFKKASAESEARAKAKAKAEATKKAREDKHRRWQMQKRLHEREKREKLRLAEHRKKNAPAPQEPAPPLTNGEAAAAQAGETALPLANGEAAAVQAGETAETAAGNAPQVPSPPTSEGAPEPASASANDATQTSSAGKLEPEPAQVNGVAVPPMLKLTPPPSPRMNGAGRGADDDDAETVISFASSIDSLLDVSPEPSEAGDRAAAGGADAEPDSDNDEFSDDPWNAVCVVGLRVYSRNGDASVAVVRPKSAIEGETPLDVDDPSKGISEETQLDHGAPLHRAVSEVEERQAAVPSGSRSARGSVY